jgi:hypothetical protein
MQSTDMYHKRTCKKKSSLHTSEGRLQNRAGLNVLESKSSISFSTFDFGFCGERANFKFPSNLRAYKPLQQLSGWDHSFS